MIPSKEAQEKYGCTEGKELFVCDQCGLLFCSEPITYPKIPDSDVIVHKCYACREGGLK